MQAQLIQGNDSFLPIQNPQDYVLTVQRGQSGYAKINLPPRQRKRDAAILWQAGFCYIQPRHHLHTHGKRRPIVFMQAAHLPQHAVDAITKAQETLLRFKMDIRGAAFHRVRQQRINQPDYRLAVFITLRRQALVVDFTRFYFIQDTIHGQLITVEAVNGFFDIRFRGKRRHDLSGAAQVRADPIQGNNIKDIRQRHFQRLAQRVIAHRHDTQAPGHFLRDHRDGFAIGHDRMQVDPLLSEYATDDIVDNCFGYEAQPHQDPAGLFAAVLLFDQRDFKLVRGNNPLVNE